MSPGPDGALPFTPRCGCKCLERRVPGLSAEAKKCPLPYVPCAGKQS